MISLESYFQPDPARLIELRKQFLNTASNASSDPAQSGWPNSSVDLFSTIGSFSTFITESFIATELVAVLAVSCAWIAHPRSELRLRAGLAPPPWLNHWLFAFRVIHCLCINLMYRVYGANTQLVPLRCAGAMWVGAIILVTLSVAVFVGRAMLRDAVEEMRWPFGKRNKIFESARYATARREGSPILRGEDVARLERNKLKRE